MTDSASPNAAGNHQTEDYRTALELEKLQAELLALRTPIWKDPKLVGAAFAFVVSIGFNVAQYHTAKMDGQRKDEELRQKEQEWSMERARTNLQIRACQIFCVAGVMK